VSRWLGIAVAALAFMVLATANSGGYRYGISDQAFYVPALAHSLDPTLFPRDAALLAPQTSRWAGDDLVGQLGRLMPVDLPTLFFVLYVVGLAGLLAASASLARGLGLSRWGIAAVLTLFTLRHRIAKTGANTLEGYMHPRMLSFAIGIGALACLVKRRNGWAIGLVLLAGLVHPTTALWFGILVAASLASRSPRARWLGLAAAAVTVTLVVVTSARMDSAWLDVLRDKDYLFPSAWPPYAWTLNLL